MGLLAKYAGSGKVPTGSERIAFLRKLLFAKTRCLKLNRFRAGSKSFREAEVVFCLRRPQVPQMFKDVLVGSMGIALS